MKPYFTNPPQTLAPVTEGYDGYLLAQLHAKQTTGVLLHIAVSDTQAQSLKEALNFFAPQATVLSFPAWDTLPYDRVSPQADIVSERLLTLNTLQKKAFKKAIVITTVNAVLQKVLPPAFFAQSALTLQGGATLPIATLTEWLTHHGYQSTTTVRESGEFAVRGGIVDVYIPTLREPLRLDYFGDTIETMRHFDALTQLTTVPATAVHLDPAKEVLLNTETTNHFRQAYRTLAGTHLDNDPLYTAVMAGKYYTGIEHWQPLFYPEMATLFDYLETPHLTLDAGIPQAITARFDEITEYYQARLAALKQKTKDAAPYYPVPPEKQFLTQEDWNFITAHYPALHFSPFVTEATVATSVQPVPSFAAARQDASRNVYAELLTFAKEQQKAKKKVIIAAYSEGTKARFINVLRDNGAEMVLEADDWQAAIAQAPKSISVVKASIDKGFIASEYSLISEQDILGDRLTRAPKKRKADAFIREASSLATGDYVVHVEHGVGQYQGLETVTLNGVAHDFVLLIYLGGDKLYVPVENIEVLSRYGSEENSAQLDKLGSASWQARKAKVKERITAMAGQLLALAAARLTQTAPEISKGEGLYEEFCARFPYPETDDQLRAIGEIEEDLLKGKPMDRLICGDVGFGKTEVALRAAFLVAQQGLQVAVVVPTTLLARQHYNNFAKRFAGFPLRVAQLSRMVTSKDASLTKQGLEEGTVDVVIGTHALLAKSIRFKNLGLVIIDEEQHFGVGQKEKLKELQKTVHSLALSATPIPRTLQMALTGVRDLSLIATPPVDRLAVRTFVLPFDPVIIREAILREKFRGGHTFYVCPRIKDLHDVAETLKKIVPEASVVTAHGQLSPTELEDIMTAFFEKKYDILLSTQIIESGIDIPTANTMIIHNAALFGLSQLYQLRGRIGRAKTRGYAYLTTPADVVTSKNALRRLEVMQTLDHLGAGFTLASHDMDIRGAGNLLGDEQSGHIREVGVELYQQMLEQAVADAKAQQTTVETTAHHTTTDWSPTIQLGIPVLIPERYVADLDVRLGLYRRAAELVDTKDIEDFTSELIDRFGALPVEVENFLKILMLKRQCLSVGVNKVDAGEKGVVIGFHNNSLRNPEALLRYIGTQNGVVKLRPDQRVFFLRSFATTAQKIKGVEDILRTLEKVMG